MRFEVAGKHRVHDEKRVQETLRFSLGAAARLSPTKKIFRLHISRLDGPHKPLHEQIEATWLQISNRHHLSKSLLQMVYCVFVANQFQLTKHSDRPTRDKALVSLRTYLSGRRDLPPLELLKLWKGLFYCMWMCDRPRPQQALAQSLADLVSVLPPTSVIPFLRGFWQTMQREWTNIDVLRMEKFLLLTRRYVATTFEACKRGQWETDLVREHMALLEEIPCNVKDVRVPNGMRFHIIDIYVDELERVGALEDAEERGAWLETLLAPLRILSKNSPTKPVRSRAKAALEDERLSESTTPAGDDTNEESEGWAGISD